MTLDRIAVVDVESTHGDPERGRLMELAVVLPVGGGKAVTWSSLVHPPVAVPPFVQRLTGIKPGTLAGAPPFHEVARAFLDLTADRLLVAHNVRFDLTLLGHELARTGLVFQRATLCTERLSRALFPDRPHHNLASMCRYFGIRPTPTHRAAADAEATYLLLHRLVRAFGRERVERAIVPLPARRCA
jgi:DNA polymerase-3 subunit epsilon